MTPNVQPPGNDHWWNRFLDTHGRGSEMQSAYQGFLTQRGLKPWALTPEQLDQHYSAFAQWLDASTQPEPAAARVAPRSAPATNRELGRTGRRG